MLKRVTSENLYSWWRVDHISRSTSSKVRVVPLRLYLSSDPTSFRGPVTVEVEVKTIETIGNLARLWDDQHSDSVDRLLIDRACQDAGLVYECGADFHVSKSPV